MAGGSNILALLAERISMYEQAEANAKAIGDTSRVRRFVSHDSFVLVIMITIYTHFYCLNL